MTAERLTLRSGAGEEALIVDSFACPVRLGRVSSLCEVPIDDCQMSRVHCQIRSSDGRFYLCDLQSTNGTSVRLSRSQTESGLCRLTPGMTFGSDNITFTTAPPHGHSSGQAAPSEAPYIEDIYQYHLQRQVSDMSWEYYLHAFESPRLGRCKRWYLRAT